MSSDDFSVWFDPDRHIDPTPEPKIENETWDMLCNIMSCVDPGKESDWEIYGILVRELTRRFHWVQAKVKYYVESGERDYRTILDEMIAEAPKFDTGGFGKPYQKGITMLYVYSGLIVKEFRQYNLIYETHQGRTKFMPSKQHISIHTGTPVRKLTYPYEYVFLGQRDDVIQLCEDIQAGRKKMPPHPSWQFGTNFSHRNLDETN